MNEWNPCIYHRTIPTRTPERTRTNVDRLWVTWMVDRLTADLRRDVGLPTRFQERCINRREGDAP